MAKQKLSSTQEHLPFAAIEEGMIILKDGGYRAVIKVGSVNFNLKTDSEQQALIGSYQNFLNSLEFNIQIIMQSRHLDLEPYLKKLEDKVLEQKNELIRQQTQDYIDYVRELINVANIMEKTFYVVVPYSPIAINKNFFSAFFKSDKPVNINIDSKQFALHKEELMQRANTVASGLGGLGLKYEILDTDDLVRLLYSVYNSDIASEERLDDASALATGVVTAKTPEEAEDDNLAGQMLEEHAAPSAPATPASPPTQPPPNSQGQ